MTSIPVFLAPAVERATTLIQIETAEGDPVIYAPMVNLCAEIALSQIESFCGRPMIFQEATECYDSPSGEQILRLTPVASVDSVYLLDVALTEATDYSLRGDKLVFIGYDSDAYLPGFIKVTYSGGFQTISESQILFSSVILQTIANYKRRDMFGLSSVDLGKGLSKSPSDSGGVLESVKNLLSPLRYYGDSYLCK